MNCDEFKDKKPLKELYRLHTKEGISMVKISNDYHISLETLEKKFRKFRRR